MQLRKYCETNKGNYFQNKDNSNPWWCEWTLLQGKLDGMFGYPYGHPTQKAGH